MKIRFLKLLPFLSLFASQILLSQNGVIKLENPSFEGVPGEGTRGGKLPDGWYDCGFPGETPPDVHPKPGGGAFQVTTKPAHGKTYLGLITRGSDTWEMVSQRLVSSLQAGMTYSFSIDLCHSTTMISASRTSNLPTKYDTPITLRIWAGDEYCSRTELLAVSPLITNDKWEKYDFKFTPTADHRYIVLEAYYKPKSPSPYNGNLLMDNASDIIKQ